MTRGGSRYFLSVVICGATFYGCTTGVAAARAIDDSTFASCIYDVGVMCDIRLSFVLFWCRRSLLVNSDR
jgi:hypothetical protein